MKMLGEFLEISLATPDMLRSHEFYRKLGFTEAPASDGRKYPYAVVTDGRLYIGLHKRGDEVHGLSFVLPELRHHVEGFEALGLDFEFRDIGFHQFNQLGFRDPDNNRVMLLEARTYSPVHAAHVQPTLCGYFLEYRLPVDDVAANARFWESLGLIVETVEGGESAQASWGGINLRLTRAGRKAKPALVFACPDLDAANALLEMRGLDVQNVTGAIRVPTPEGLDLLLQTEDI
ncbi:MAG: VOC family protein [Bacillota bacterium]